MNKTLKKSLSILLALLMLASVCTTQLAFAATAVGKVGTLKVASVSQTQIKLKWSKVSKASGYCVYSYDAKKDRWLVETYTGETTFTDKSLNAGTKYTYKVAAYVKNGTTRTFGKDSKQVSALTKPARVSKLTATQKTPAKIQLKWSAAAGATGYILYGRTKDGEYKKIKTLTNRTYTVTYPAAPGVMYYRVRAYVKNGSLKQYAAKYSPVAKVSTKPAPVTSITATNIGGASATLKWAASAGASEYIIFKKDSSTNDKFVEVATTTKTTYAVKYPASPRTVHFSVQASATVNGQVTKAAVSAPVYVSMWPKAVTSLTLKKADHDALTLEWPKADGASEYHVYQYINGELQEIGVTEKTTFVVKNLEPETSYSFRVRAVANFEGLITETEISPVLTAETTFGAIKGATVVLNTSNTAVLSWNALPGAAGYEIEQKIDGEWSKIGETDTTVFSVSDLEKDKVLAVGATYVYRIRAYLTQDGETVYSPYTKELEIHSLPAKPEKPIIAAGADHSIVIDWPTVPGADSYQLQFYNEDGKWVDDTLMGEIHTYTYNGQERTSFRKIMKDASDSGLHQYRVAAAVQNDGRWTCGAYSQPVSIKYTYEPEPEYGYTEALKETGLVGYLLDTKEGVFFTADDPWQRNFGFNKLYDFASQFFWIQYDTTRFLFTYQDSDWMLQPWKGQYGAILYGAELGVYKKYTDREADHYDCAQDQDLLMMSMDFERFYWTDKEKTKGEWRHEFSRPYGSYWWCTGFKLGYIRLAKPTEIITINENKDKQTFPEIRANYRVTVKDYEMLHGLVQGMKDAGYKEITYKDGVKPGNLQFAYHDLDVYFPF